MWTSRGDLIPGDWGDARLVVLLLEHGYQALFGVWPEALTSTPWAYAPNPNSYFYTETMLGGLPFYVPFRLWLDPFGAFLGWLVLCASLNYIAMTWLLLRGFKLTWLAAIAGAYLFAFAMPRHIQLMHPQLLPQFLTPICLYFGLRAWQESKSARSSLLWWISAGILAAWQCWACFYLGWFLILGLGGLALTQVWSKQLRITLMDELSQRRKGFALALLAFAIIMVPYVIGYSSAQQVVGERPYSEISGQIPRLGNYLLTHPNSMMYASLLTDWSRRMIRMSSLTEGHMFAGFLALLSPFLIPLWIRRDRLIQNHMLLSAAKWFWLLVVIATATRTGYGLWYLVAHGVPGGGAIRSVGRIILLLLIPMSLCLALWVHLWWTQRGAGWKRWLAIGLLGLMVFENQMNPMLTFSRQGHAERMEHIATAITPQMPCDLFFLRSEENPDYVHIDAMWFSMTHRMPTINGRLGNHPPGWDFEDTISVTHDELKHYLNRDDLKLCDVRVAVNEATQSPGK